MKPYASLSLDLDNRWSYLKTHGDPSWESYPSYLDTVVPRVLEILAKRSWHITFFIVGKDAAEPRNRPLFRAIADAGHEFGNHSFHHEPWLPSYERIEIENEIRAAEEAIRAAGGKLPRGFRGPGFCTSPVLLDVLKARGYVYDASSLPTFIGPLARLYYFATSHLTPEERKRRSALFGGVSDALRPLRAHVVPTASGNILEIPVTTFPGLRVPMHLSYIIYLATVSPFVALAYLRAALGACRLIGVAPSMLLHPLDFLGNDDVYDLGFFPGMRWGREVKLAFVERALDVIASSFEVVHMSEHARRVST
jgi:peptidoglycan-N-acetylglucosamine deacetylase